MKNLTFRAHNGTFPGCGWDFFDDDTWHSFGGDDFHGWWKVHNNEVHAWTDPVNSGKDDNYCRVEIQDAYREYKLNLAVNNIIVGDGE